MGQIKAFLDQIDDTTFLAIGSSFCHFVWFSVYKGSQQLKNEKRILCKSWL